MEITINELAEGNITFILVTHNTDEILPVFGKALLLKDGQVHSQGDIDDMIQYDNLSDFYGANVDVFKHKDRSIFRWPTQRSKGLLFTLICYIRND